MTHPASLTAGERAALLLAAIVDSSEDAVISKDLDGIITSWNKSAERLFGYSEREAIGKAITLIIPPDRLQEEPQILARIRAGEKIEHFETVRRRKDGTLVEIAVTISPIRNGEGVIVGASKIARDVTELNRADRARRLLSSIVDSSDDAIISKDLNGVITSWNKSAERLFGYTEPEAIGQPITMLIPTERLDEEPQIIDRIRAGDRVEHFETIRCKKDGTLLDISLTISPIRDSQGQIVGASKIARDITERRRADAEIRRANKDLEQFAFSASHDLQEPLRTVKIYSELLMRSLGDSLDGEHREFLNYLHQGASRMESLVQDLLAYSRASRFEASFLPVAADQALDAALVALGGAIGNSGAVITRDPLPTVHIGIGHLQQLFQNLIGNAIKYRSPDRQPAIRIGVKDSGAECTFFVGDNGLGIDPQYKETIFELFTRLHNREEYSGTGIGLAICQRIVERYDGRIWVEPTPGAGSTFYFTIRR